MDANVFFCRLLVVSSFLVTLFAVKRLKQPRIPFLSGPVVNFLVDQQLLDFSRKDAVVVNSDSSGEQDAKFVNSDSAGEQDVKLAESDSSGEDVKLVNSDSAGEQDVKLADSGRPGPVLLDFDVSDLDHTNYRTFLGYPDFSRLPSPAVPFWVYDSPEFQPFRNCRIRPKSHPNHIGELHFIWQLEGHPWRVVDPKDAAIFIVPIPISALHFNSCGDVRLSAVPPAAEIIRNSWQYSRNMGWDHLLVGTDWKVHRRLPESLRSVSDNFTVAHKGFFTPSPWRCVINAPHCATGNIYKTPVEQTLDEFKATRKYTFFFQGQTKKNSGYAIRRKAMRYLPGFHSPNILVTSSFNSTYPKCNSTLLEGCEDGRVPGQVFHQRLRDSKLNLFFRGDDFASARMYDSIWEGTPNIVFSDEIWERGLPSQCQVPWERMTFRGNEDEFNVNPRVHLDDILSRITDDELKLRLDTMKWYGADVLWNVAGSRLGTNIIYNTARKCVPADILRKNSAGLEDLKCEFADPSLFLIPTVKSP